MGRPSLQPLAEAPPGVFGDVSYVLCDLDDTLTNDGYLPAASYEALEKLQAAGRQIIIVTGRPAGWCDMIARFWPVAGVVGENGAFYFRYDRALKTMKRVFQRGDAERARDQLRLGEILDEIRSIYPNVALSADQAYRISDIAIDFCEDVAPLDAARIKHMVAILQEGGATAKISSIHINAWMGDFSKLEMAKRLLAECFDVPEQNLRLRCAYVGDSPNDEPMFAYFDHAIGVANVMRFKSEMTDLPRWVTKGEGGIGFAEFARVLIISA